MKRTAMPGAVHARRADGRRRVVVVAMLALAALLPSAPAGAASTTVAAGAVTKHADGLCSLSEAIDNANDDAATHADCPAGSGADAITLPAGTYPLGGFSRSKATAFDITSDITLIGAGAVARLGGSVTVLDGGDKIRHFRVQPGASLTLQDLRLVRGLASEGSDGWGWGSWWGPDGGGAVDNLGVLTTLRVAFVDNHSTTVGGAVRNTCERATNKEWGQEERCSSAPPGVLLADATSFEANTASDSGGAIANQGPASEAHITGSTLSGNRAPSGAAIRTQNYASIAGSSITSNVAQYDDDDAFYAKAVIHNETGLLNISTSTIARNTGISAVTNYTDGRLRMTEVAVADNRARGITNVSTVNDYKSYASVLIADTAVTGNVGHAAGGIWNRPEAYCSWGEIHHGYCSIPGMHVRDSTVSGNRALGSIYQGNPAGPTGGIRSEFGQLGLEGVTIVRNSSGDEDDAQLLTTTVENEYGDHYPGSFMRNTVVADPVRGTNCFDLFNHSPIWGGSHNMTDDATCVSGGFTQVGDVLLAPLGDYGGPTLTHVPHPASPVIHAGHQDRCDDHKYWKELDEPVTDQRGTGFLRTVGPVCDIGAVEADTITLTSVLSFDVERLRFASGPYNGNEGLRASLRSKLEAAGDAIRRGDDNAAAGQVRAFANQVDAHRGARIAEPDAERLVAGAHVIRTLLDEETSAAPRDGR